METNTECYIQTSDSLLRYSHCDDYEPMEYPLPVEYRVVHAGPMCKHILRVSWKGEGGSYIPMTFVLDTAAVADIVLSEKALEVLLQNNIINECESVYDFNGRKRRRELKETKFKGILNYPVTEGEITQEKHKITFKISPHTHDHHVNVIGLHLITRLKLLQNFSEYKFSRHFEFF